MIYPIGLLVKSAVRAQTGTTIQSNPEPLTSMAFASGYVAIRSHFHRPSSGKQGLQNLKVVRTHEEAMRKLDWLTCGLVVLLCAGCSARDNPLLSSGPRPRVEDCALIQQATPTKYVCDGRITRRSNCPRYDLAILTSRRGPQVVPR